MNPSGGTGVSGGGAVQERSRDVTATERNTNYSINKIYTDSKEKIEQRDKAEKRFRRRAVRVVSNCKHRSL